MGINPRNLAVRTNAPLPFQVGAFLFTLSALGLGMYIDRVEAYRLTRFRDKSMLYGKPKAEGEAPSWGGEYWTFCK